MTTRGFSLIELLILIVVIGIMAAVAMQSMTVAVDDTRRLQTERKLERVANAIVGDPEKMQDGIRSDFGYVGDVGAFPSNLAALYTNPGLALWNGPYIQLDYAEDTGSYRIDAWGQTMSYSGGTSISSSGHGSPLAKKICDSTADYLLNTVVGSVRDKNDSTPGLIKKDSVSILVDIPSGGSGLVTRVYAPLSSGAFTCDSVPAGKRFFRIVYKPANDTLRRHYTVLPRHQGNPPLLARFASAYFGAGGGGSCTGNDSVILRPMGAGSLTEIPTRTNCAANWQCVSESVADGSGTEISQWGWFWSTDVYALSDPPSSSCSVASVTVYCRAKKDWLTGDIAPSVYVSGTEYNGTSSGLSGSWTNYSYTWATSPATGVAWTWSEITGLQAGPRLRGGLLSYCHVTQVWVVVKY